MPTNRRPLNRRQHGRAEVHAWEAYMNWGRDYFGDLTRAGFSAEDIEREAPDVWHRHAEKFMALWRTDPNHAGRLPYGAKRFGH